MFCCCPTIICNPFAFIHWLLLRSGSRAKWELLGLQTHTTTTRTNTGPTPGTFFGPIFLCLFIFSQHEVLFAPKSDQCNSVPGSLGTQWSECSHQEPRAWITRSCPYSVVKAMIPNELQFWPPVAKFLSRDLMDLQATLTMRCQQQHGTSQTGLCFEILKFLSCFFVWGNAVLT